MITVVQTGEDERLRVTSGDRVVNIHREYLVRFSDPPRWKVDPEAGLSIFREHVPALIAAMASPMPSDDRQRIVEKLSAVDTMIKDNAREFAAEAALDAHDSGRVGTRVPGARAGVDAQALQAVSEGGARPGGSPEEVAPGPRCYACKTQVTETTGKHAVGIGWRCADKDACRSRRGIVNDLESPKGSPSPNASRATDDEREIVSGMVEERTSEASKWPGLIDDIVAYGDGIRQQAIEECAVWLNRKIGCYVGEDMVSNMRDLKTPGEPR